MINAATQFIREMGEKIIDAIIRHTVEAEEGVGKEFTVNGGEPEPDWRFDKNNPFCRDEE